MDVQGLRDLVKGMNATQAKETLHRVLDEFEKSAGAALSNEVADLQTRVLTEVRRGATRAVADPKRAALIGAIFGAVSFVAGAACYALLFCK